MGLAAATPCFRVTQHLLYELALSMEYASYYSMIIYYIKTALASYGEEPSVQGGGGEAYPPLEA